MESHPPTQPSDMPQGATAALRLVSAMLGLEALCCLVVAVWPDIVPELVRAFWLDFSVDLGLLRLLAIGGFVSAVVGRVVIRRGLPSSRVATVWAEFASQTGGTFAQERPRVTASGLEGGPTVRWNVRGLPVSLTRTLQRRSGSLARFQCAMKLERPLRFLVTRRTAVSRALSSPRLWGMALEMTRNASGEGVDQVEAKRVADEMAFLARPAETIGDPLFDDAFLLKCDDGAAAREVFSDAGIGHWLREVNGKGSGWSLSLMAGGAPGRYLLALDLPGSGLDPAVLRAGYSFLDAAIGRLRDRGLATPDTTAAA